MAILLLCTVGPILGYIASLVAMYFYPMTRKDEIEMEKKLDSMTADINDADLNI